MPSAYIIDAGHIPAAETRPDLHIVPPPSLSGGDAVSVPAVPVAQVPEPAGPTARIHWIGRFVDYRHPEDLYADIQSGASNLVIVDARYHETFLREHLPRAINLPVREIDERTTALLSRDREYVVYCWNASCHASTKAAQRLESLGFKVKELHGGLQDWKKQGYPTERA
jgi:rhodanese-related sulfurtransferase